MVDISLSVVTAEYDSDRGFLVRAHRILAETVFTSRSGVQVPYGCILDTGAPFSVIPFSLWNVHGIPYAPRGDRLRRRAQQAPTEALQWQGVSCELGETEVSLIDHQRKVQAG